MYQGCRSRDSKNFNYLMLFFNFNPNGVLITSVLNADLHNTIYSPLIIDDNRILPFVGFVYFPEPKSQYLDGSDL